MDKSTKEISSIFLAIVLVTGTISLSYPSFMIVGEAQAQPYYGMDSYGSLEYGNDNSYDKPQYPSYGKDDKRDKSKDSSKSVDIKKINCINTNININGNNTGDINLGNKGQVAAEGYSGTYSSGSGSGYGGSDEGYYDGNYKKDKGITCIINNNNNNTNIVADGNGDEELSCEECWEENLNQAQFLQLQTIFGTDVFGTGNVVNNLEELCTQLESQATAENLNELLNEVLDQAGITLGSPEFFELQTCIAAALGIELPPQLPMN